KNILGNSSSDMWIHPEKIETVAVTPITFDHSDNYRMHRDGSKAWKVTNRGNHFFSDSKAHVPVHSEKNSFFADIDASGPKIMLLIAEDHGSINRGPGITPIAVLISIFTFTGKLQVDGPLMRQPTAHLLRYRRPLIFHKIGRKLVQLE